MACAQARLLGCALLCSALLCAALPSAPGRLVCWQAIMYCQSEPDCNYAYDHYLRACAPVLQGQRRKCPSHCIASLVQLNATRRGPALEDCSCGGDALCQGTRRAIEPCLPRTSSAGCTEARRQCEADAQCGAAMRDYLRHCGKLFGGAVCTSACRAVIADMRRMPKGQQLDTCMCDGAERAICEFVKSSMNALCSDPAGRAESSGAGAEPPDDEDYALELDEPDDEPEESDGCSAHSPRLPLTLLACAWTLVWTRALDPL